MIWLMALLFAIVVAVAYGIYLLVSTVHHKYMAKEVRFPARETLHSSDEVDADGHIKAQRISEAAMVLSLDEFIENMAMVGAAAARGEDIVRSWDQELATDPQMISQTESFVRDVSGIKGFTISDFSAQDVRLIDQAYRFHVFSRISSTD